MRSANLNIRVDPARLDLYRLEAHSLGLTLTEWVKRAMDAALPRKKR